MRRAMTHLVWISLFLSGAAFAEGRVATLHDVAVIENGEGAARVLFRAGGLGDLGNVAISRATLTVSTIGVPEERALELWIHPVTRAWNPGSVDWHTGWDRPGGDFDEELPSIAPLDLRTPVSELSFDVTGVLKEIVESGMEAHGFILTVAPRDGIGLAFEDVPRLGGLANASLEFRYRKVPPPPGRRGL